MDSFISCDSKNTVNDVMDGVKLDDVKLRYWDNIQKTTHLKILDTIITEIGKPVIRRWYHHRGTITDIIKTARQVKKIRN